MKKKLPPPSQSSLYKKYLPLLNNLYGSYIVCKYNSIEVIIFLLQDYKIFQLSYHIYVNRNSIKSICDVAVYENKEIELEDFKVRFSNEAYVEYQNLLQIKSSEINKHILKIYEDFEKYMKLYQVDITKVIYYNLRGKIKDYYFGARRILSNYYVVFTKDNNGEVVILEIKQFTPEAHIPSFKECY